MLAVDHLLPKCFVVDRRAAAAPPRRDPIYL